MLLQQEVTDALLGPVWAEARGSSRLEDFDALLDLVDDELLRSLEGGVNFRCPLKLLLWR